MESKSFDKNRVLTGVVMSPNTPTAYSVWYNEQTIRDMAYTFMLEADKDKSVDLYHDKTPVACRIVESYIVKGESKYIKGSWVVSVYIEDDRILKLVKENKINAFSVTNAVTVKRAESTYIDMAASVSGATTTNQEHNHLFYLEYDKNTNRYIGRTSTEDGHYHLVNQFGITEEAGDSPHIHAYNLYNSEGMNIPS